MFGLSRLNVGLDLFARPVDKIGGYRRFVILSTCGLSVAVLCSVKKRLSVLRVFVLPAKFQNTLLLKQY